MDYLAILKKYWGYTCFRPKQEDIIRSIGEGKDTLGLLPTGGGKSITFQVPALALEGVCLVVTPLISLMKDQVNNLADRGIMADYIYSGLTHREILHVLENAERGEIKFLYISPERISTEIFQNRLKFINVNLIAVDEAHCISQWGYDFRPSYLKIKELRTLKPNVPILALTATATTEVVQDIQDQLSFPSYNVFQTSFNRPNLVYVVRNTEDKLQQVKNILDSIPGSAIIYAHSRLRCKEYASLLQNGGYSANFYHAGLSHSVKDLRQTKWHTGECRIMVATNAFGMGIDKSNVRCVIHLDLPDSIEAYFQEAGRAGRDGKRAYAVLLYSERDDSKLVQRYETTFPQKESIKQIYHALAEYYVVGAGSGQDAIYTFDLEEFCTEMHFSFQSTFHAIKILEYSGYLKLTEPSKSPSKAWVRIPRDRLYNFHFRSPFHEELLELLLRSYPGILTDKMHIDEEYLAKKLHASRDIIYTTLVELAKDEAIQYMPFRKTCLLIYTQNRVTQKELHFPAEAYDIRKKRFGKQLRAILDYAQSTEICHNQMLLEYFGEQDTHPCGKCDVCNHNKRIQKPLSSIQTIQKKVLELLLTKDYNLDDLINHLPYQYDTVAYSLEKMLERQDIQHSKGIFSLPKKKKKSDNNHE